MKAEVAHAVASVVEATVVDTWEGVEEVVLLDSSTSPMFVIP